MIKAGQSFKAAQRLTAIDLADHLAQAERIMDEARTQARAIEAQSRREAAGAIEAAKRQGYADGHATGHAAGLEAGQALALSEARERFERELSNLRDTLVRLIADFETAKGDLLIAARHDTLEFAVGLAGRVAKRIGELDRSAASANLEEALRLVTGQAVATVRANPADVESLGRFAEELMTRVAGCSQISLVEDPTISPGGCIVYTATTRIDARIESQIEEIARLLLGHREAPAASN